MMYRIILKPARINPLSKLLQYRVIACVTFTAEQFEAFAAELYKIFSETGARLWSPKQNKSTNHQAKELKNATNHTTRT